MGGLTKFLKRFSRKPPYAKGNYAFRKIMHRLFINKKENTIRSYIINLLNERGQVLNLENYNTEARIGNLPYLFTKFGTHEISLLVDTGSDVNLLTYTTYNKIKQFEIKSSAPKIKYCLTTYTGTSQENIISRIATFGIKLQGNIYKVRFFVTLDLPQFKKNILGMEFIHENRLNIIYNHDLQFYSLSDYDGNTIQLQCEKNRNLYVNNSELLPELSGQQSNHVTPHEEGKTNNMFSSIIYGQGLFEIYKDKEEIDKKMNEIFLSNFHFQIEAKNDMPEVNMDYLPDDQFFPTDKLNEWMNDKLLFPTKIEGGYLEYEHNMSPNQKSQVDQLFLEYEKAIATPTEPIGCFKLFQVSLNFLEGRKSHQAKRNIDWNKSDHEIKRKEIKEGKAIETPPSQFEQEIKSRYRLTCDLSDVNAIVQGNTRISLNKPEEIMEQINNCYMSPFDSCDSSKL